jgi:hypothetical protein
MPAEFFRRSAAALLGHGAERVSSEETSAPPAIAPDAPLIWKGGKSRPLLVSDRAMPEALASLRQRSLVFGGIGAALVAYALYELAALFRA